MGYLATIDQPKRFANSRNVGPYLGLTPRRYQSGEVDLAGRISKCGDRILRSLLFGAAGVLLFRNKQASPLKKWGLLLARRVGSAKTRVAVARKLAAVLYRLWVDQTVYRYKCSLLSLARRDTIRGSLQGTMPESSRDSLLLGINDRGNHNREIPAFLTC